MSNRVIAIGLDSAEPRLLEKWMEQGHLKNLAKLRKQGAYGRLENTVDYAGKPTEQCATEASWVAFLTGCMPTRNGYWGTVKYHASRYEATKNKQDGSYYFEEFSPFYALGNDFKVVTFDIPTAKPAKNVNGLQIQDWGGHFPFSTGWSVPEDVLPDINERYGKNAVLFKDHGYWWKKEYVESLKERLRSSITTRTKICRELMQKNDWDLFITTFIDTHSAAHSLWHLSKDTGHPLYEHLGDKNSDPLLEAFELVDEGIGEIMDAAPENAYVVCFSVHGMGNNVTDLNSMAFLPELLYRYNFPGKLGIAPGDTKKAPPKEITKPLGNSWSGIVWRKMHDANPIRRFLKQWTPGSFWKAPAGSGHLSPRELDDMQDPLSRMPAEWYKQLWPQMKAFAIPSFSDGHIRINLAGRERDGIVPPSEYDALCDEIARLVYSLKDSRTGNPLAAKVVRTRKSANEPDRPGLPDADLIVKWHEDHPTDVVESEEFGRIGPIPFYRTGGHRSSGTVFAMGPGIEQGSQVEGGHIVDLTATILDLLGAPKPEQLEGNTLIKPTSVVA